MMFLDEVGEQLKSLAKIFCYCGIALSVIAAVVMLMNEVSFLIAVAVCVGGSLVSWVSNLVLFAFGEITSAAMSVNWTTKQMYKDMGKSKD